MGVLVIGELNMVMCTFGTGPGMLLALPTSLTFINGMPLATIMDMAPIVNLPPFPTCVSPAPSPIPPVKPCIPSVAGPWIPGVPNVLAGGLPALDNLSKAICSRGGIINIMIPGQFQVISAG